MPSPSVDIIVPIWNNPDNARRCLGAILTNSPGARLIIVDNASNRQTQLVMEEFTETLGERCLFLSSDKSEEFVRLINKALTHSRSDFSVIIRPHVAVTKDWLGPLIKAADTGIASPHFSGHPPFSVPLVRGCSMTETFALSFSTLAIKTDARALIGGFDEQLDGGLWCLRDYICRAGSKGYRTRMAPTSTVVCAPEALMGSSSRRKELDDTSQSVYSKRWGVARNYGVYFGRNAVVDSLTHTMETFLDAARRGHRFTLFLHHNQVKQFAYYGWNKLHTSIETKTLSRLAPKRDLLKVLQNREIIAVQGTPDAVFDDNAPVIPFRKLAGEIGQA